MFSTPTTSRQASRKPRTASHQVATRTPPGSGSRRASQTQGSSPQYHGTPGPSSRLAQNVTTIEESVGDISMEQEEHAEARFSNEDEASSGTFSAGVFVRTPELKVSFFASLPLEVQQVLKTAGLYTLPSSKLLGLTLPIYRFPPRCSLWYN